MSALRTRILPAIALTAVVGGAIFSQTAGGKQQPRGRAKADPDTQIPVSETLQHLAGTGGPSARTALKLEDDPKDTRRLSKDPTEHSKRSALKTTGDSLDGEEGRKTGAGKNVNPPK